LPDLSLRRAQPSPAAPDATREAPAVLAVPPLLALQRSAGNAAVAALADALRESAIEELECEPLNELARALSPDFDASLQAREVPAP
jgi:hypothetical protein